MIFHDFRDFQKNVTLAAKIKNFLTFWYGGIKNTVETVVTRAENNFAAVFLKKVIIAEKSLKYQ